MIHIHGAMSRSSFYYCLVIIELEFVVELYYHFFSYKSGIMTAVPLVNQIYLC